MSRHAIAVAAVATLLAAPVCPAQSEYEVKSLTVGDPAPA